MKLSKRLKAIADMIPEKVRVIDVGCDHALLDIYLTLNGKNECIASDINKNVLKNTKDMIDRYQLENQILVLEGDGLDHIQVEKEDMIVLAGMGTATILHILEKKFPNHLLIESHTHLTELRSEIVKKGYIIKNEVVVFDKNIYYVIIEFQKGIAHYTEQELFLGPILMQKKDSVTMSYFESLYKKKQKLKTIPNDKREIITKEIDYLESVLKKKENC